MKRRRIDERTQQLLSPLAARIAQRDAEVRDLETDKRLSDEYRRSLQAQARTHHAIVGEGEARAAWKAAQRRVEKARANLEAQAANYEAFLSSTGVATRRGRYESELRRPLAMGETMESRLQRLAGQAALSAEGRAAFADIVLSGAFADSSPDSVAATAHLTAQAQAWERESRAALDAAQAETAAAEDGLDHVREGILRAETALTGARHGAWDGISPWQENVLKETHESLGMVVNRGEAVASTGA